VGSAKIQPINADYSTEGMESNDDTYSTLGAHMLTRNTHQSGFDHCKHKHTVAVKQGREREYTLQNGLQT